MFFSARGDWMTGAWLDQVLTGGLCGESLLLLSLAEGGSHFVPPQTVALVPIEIGHQDSPPDRGTGFFLC